MSASVLRAAAPALRAIVAQGSGHSHARRGVWDPDNGAAAGTICTWCAVDWPALLALVAALPPGPTAQIHHSP